MRKKILFVVATHGDEPIGPALLKKLAKQEDNSKKYTSVVGNPRALAQSKRYRG